MEGIRDKSLAVDLGMEIILGCDIFDAQDIWGLLEGATPDELKQLEQETREYILKTWPPESGAWTQDFVDRQIKFWIYQELND